ncbi:RICIN domain-containing protein [Actinoplanes xinjiangensis]|uniref:RICIN domain-containing protein n=1 Tax=Actinoplanes xinjiangensis TaxID=512350 RepID=UPI00343A110A
MKLPRIGRAAAVIALFAGSMAGIPSLASASSKDARGAAARDVVNIRSILNNKCLEIKDSKIDKGAYVGMWDCWGGVTTHWYWDGDQIRRMLTHGCLEIRDSDARNGAYVSMWDCWGGPATRWYRDGELIRSKLNNKCLEVRDSDVDNGADVSMWDCWGGASTRWYMTPVAD